MKAHAPNKRDPKHCAACGAQWPCESSPEWSVLYPSAALEAERRAGQ